ncbi:uncharacterized protein LOC141534558 [Cotesia typhae]|uniref:uncharacterized protein LOC141534558 n=1 Tax=Cotesia typhae TaxID=2053667 RepID=UPI003D6951AA
MGKSKKRRRERDDNEIIEKRICRLERVLGDFIKTTQEHFEKAGGGQTTSTSKETIPPNNQEKTDTAESAKESEKVTNTETDSPEVAVETEAQSDPTLTSSAETDLSKEKVLDEDVETVLGADPTAGNKKDLDLHPSLLARWPTWLSVGLPKESKESVLDKYSRKGNINLEAPELNEEMLITLNESGVKRDKLFTAEQNLVGSAMSAVGDSISLILKDDEEPVDHLVLLERLADTGKLLAQLHFQISSARKSFISPVLSKPMKELLQKTKLGVFLYGEKLTEKIKAVKSIKKFGKEMKNTLPTSTTTSFNKFTKTNQKPVTSRSLNWKSSHANQGNSYVGPRTSHQKFSKSNPQSSRSAYSNTPNQTKTNRTTYQDRKK